MNTVILLLLSVTVLLYALVSRRAFGQLVSAPLVFTAFGLFLGNIGIGWIELPVSSEALTLLAEVTLVLTLFADASSINITRLHRDHEIPLRLLGFGLPLTILAGLLLAMLLLPDLSLLGAALVAIILAPTDAALGQAVVVNPAVPEPIRRGLNVESGLNDGLVFPLLVIVASLELAEGATTGSLSFLGWSGFVFMQLTLGPLAGVGIGWLGARLTDHAIDRNEVSTAFLRLSTLALPTTAYATAELIGGNGFLSAFVCGLTVGAISTPLRNGIADFAEAEGELLSLFVFFALGAVLLPATLPAVQWSHVLYAFLSLTVIRMLPVALCLRKLGLDRSTLLFLGWFGPRGLASVIYLLVLTNGYSLDAIDQIGTVVLLTVALSIVMHGVSAAPLAKRYGTARNDDQS